MIKYDLEIFYIKNEEEKSVLKLFDCDIEHQNLISLYGEKVKKILFVYKPPTYRVNSYKYEEYQTSDYDLDYVELYGDAVTLKNIIDELIKENDEYNRQ
jgi:hypothetical protein